MFKKRKARKAPVESEPMSFGIYSVEAIQPPLENPKDWPDLRRVDQACLEICQKYPWDLETRRMNRTTTKERQELLELSSNAGMKVDGLISMIRHSHGIYSDVLQQVKAMQPKKQ
ncbi:hypothetical protein ACFLRF_04325 [Candidatus Altiarchaeota archaeon]